MYEPMQSTSEFGSNGLENLEKKRTDYTDLGALCKGLVSVSRLNCVEHSSVCRIKGYMQRGLIGFEID